MPCLPARSKTTVRPEVPRANRLSNSLVKCANKVLASDTCAASSSNPACRITITARKLATISLNFRQQGTPGDACAMAPFHETSTLRPSRSKSPSLRRGVSTIRFVKPAIIRSANRRPSSRSTSKRSSRPNNSSRYWRLRRSRSASAHASLSSSFGPSSHACRRFRSRSAQAAMSASDTAHGSLPVSESLLERRGLGRPLAHGQSPI